MIVLGSDPTGTDMSVQLLPAQAKTRPHLTFLLSPRFTPQPLATLTTTNGRHVQGFFFVDSFRPGGHASYQIQVYLSTKGPDGC